MISSTLKSPLASAALVVACGLLLQGCRKPGSQPDTRIGHGGHMDCGDGVSLCGVLVLETGLAEGVYHHREPVVHGLWPQTGHYGSSKCILPDADRDPKRIYSCYDQAGQSHKRLESFQEHEWEKHGRCAGVDNADDYFRQVCDLSREPLKVMQDAKDRGFGLRDIARTVHKAGYHVWDVQGHTSEIHLSACADVHGDWRLAAPQDFAKVGCATRAQQGEASASRCEPSQHGPPCNGDADCKGHPGCVRCAKSGYCTTEHLASSSLQRSRQGQVAPR